MKRSQILSEVAHKAIREQVYVTAPHFFVPIDFSDASSNALGYALFLAKHFDGHIHLFHSFDIGRLPVSESALSINHAFRNLQSRATQKLNSFKEIITEQNIAVTSNVVAGKFNDEVIRELIEINSDFLVLGEGKMARQLIDRLRYKGNKSILLVPPDKAYKIPERILFLSDGRPIKESSLGSFAKLAEWSDHEVTVLETKATSIKRLLFNYQVPIAGRLVAISRKFQLVQTGSHEEYESVIDDTPDLVCSVVRKPSWVERLFRTKSAKPKFWENNYHLLILE